jgi:tRNA(fMet)-specific endonuclease VapC
MTFLVDTEIFIDIRNNVQTGIDAINAHAAGLSVNVITVAELLDGAYGSPDPERQRALVRTSLRGYRRLGLTMRVIDTFARQRQALRQQWLLIPAFDLLIASTALAHNLTLMTRNMRHFTRIPGPTLYQW